MAFLNGLGESPTVTRIKQTMDINKEKIANLRAKIPRIIQERQNWGVDLENALRNKHLYPEGPPEGGR